jgi:hypothetical protein
MRLFRASFEARTGKRVTRGDPPSLFPDRKKVPQTIAANLVSALGRDRAETAHFVLCKPWGLCYTLPGAHRFRLFLGSSAVEHSTVNRMVAGSNPARGAISDFARHRGWSPFRFD